MLSTEAYQVLHANAIRVRGEEATSRSTYCKSYETANKFHLALKEYIHEREEWTGEDLDARAAHVWMYSATASRNQRGTPVDVEAVYEGFRAFAKKHPGIEDNPLHIPVLDEMPQEGGNRGGRERKPREEPQPQPELDDGFREDDFGDDLEEDDPEPEKPKADFETMPEQPLTRAALVKRVMAWIDSIGGDSMTYKNGNDVVKWLTERVYIAKITGGMHKCNLGLYGLPGVGKSFSVYSEESGLTKILGAKCFTQNICYSKSEYVGYEDAHGNLVHKPGADAVIYARDHPDEFVILLEEEWDAWDAQVSVATNGLKDNGGIFIPKEGYVKRLDNLVIVSTMNTPGTGATKEFDRNRQDNSTLSRMKMYEVKWNPEVAAAQCNGDEELQAVFVIWNEACIMAKRPTNSFGYRELKNVYNERLFGTDMKSIVKECLFKSAITRKDGENILSHAVMPDCALAKEIKRYISNLV